MSSQSEPQFVASAQILNTTDSTTVYSGPAVLRGVWVNAAFSAHACGIENGETAVFTLPASLAVGWYDLGDTYFDTSIVYDPANDSSAGSVSFVYKRV